MTIQPLAIPVRFISEAQELREAQMADLLAEGVREGRITPGQARTVIVHALRRRHLKKQHLIRPRSIGAQASIDKWAPERPPENKSPDALHGDHVGPALDQLIAAVTTVDGWRQELAFYAQVACVTEAENQALNAVESSVQGPDKYPLAGVAFTDALPRPAADRPPHLQA